MGIDRMWVGMAAALVLIGCAAVEVPPQEAEWALRIKNDSLNRIYEVYFTAFIGAVDSAGVSSVPIRFATAPRGGFMDSGYLMRRVPGQ